MIEYTENKNGGNSSVRFSKEAAYDEQRAGLFRESAPVFATGTGIFKERTV